MKHLFLFITVILFSSSLIANTLPTKDSEAKITKFEISNMEVLNLDNGFIGNYTYKRNNCEDEGYSFFSPFYEQPQLIDSKITSFKTDNGIDITLSGENFSSNFRLSNIKISNDKSIADIDIVKEGVTYKSKLYGVNLSKAFIFENFSKFKETSMFYDEDCPPCFVVGVIAIASMCKNAQEACSPCNGNLTVYICGCSCRPAQQN